MRYEWRDPWKCSVCLLPVTQRRDRGRDRTRSQDGGWDHTTCAVPRSCPDDATAEERLVFSILGDPALTGRRSASQRLMAASRGHETSSGREVDAAGRYRHFWSCSCGINRAADSPGQGTADKRRHITEVLDLDLGGTPP